MGLDTSHNAWHGPYSRFDRFRFAIAKAAGLGDLNQYEGYNVPLGDHIPPPLATKFPSIEVQPLVILLDHSDCDGEILLEHQEPLRQALLALYDRIEPEWRPELTQFCQGLADATAEGEPVEFH